MSRSCQDGSSGLATSIFLLYRKCNTTSIKTPGNLKEPLSTTINLPFRREKLAHYLSADRSAISRELMRMEKDGLIQVTRNQISLFYMLSPPN
ncbi:helix-turn-helix domain-containing protein [Acetobacterium sp. KB-1]|uniref:helix-turn-helix domain-containing protein n=1 Tax=Acetobacterium sp. KB-1 TaxID=2184575 RepID=UPI000DBEC327|nr:hypothetical protein DOZ58_17010 [Acetobacterium sp. KB-1]